MNTAEIILVVALGAVLVGSALLVLRLSRTKHSRSTTDANDAAAESSDGEPWTDVLVPPSSTHFVLDGGGGRRLYAELIQEESSALANVRELPTHQASSLALDKVLDAVPYIGLALKGGKWVRILNPEALELGNQIQAHAGGFLGGVFGRDSKFAAQLRFSSPQEIAEIATPLALFKVASAVTGQYHLDRINAQLITIEGQVRQIRQELRNATYGDITSAAEACVELEEGLALSLDLTGDERMRLVTEESKIDKAYHQKLKDVQDFIADVSNLFSEEKLDRKELERILTDADATRFYDLQLLAYAAAVRHKLNILRAQVDLDAPDGRGGLAQRKMERELSTMRSDLLDAAKALSRISITRDRAKDRWELKGWRGPPKRLDVFAPKGHALSRQIRATANKGLTAPAPTPVLLEAFVDDTGVVRVISAALEAEEAPSTRSRQLPSARSKDRKLARLRVLKEREKELARRDSSNALKAVRAQLAEVETKSTSP